MLKRCNSLKVSLDKTQWNGQDGVFHVVWSCRDSVSFHSLRGSCGCSQLIQMNNWGLIGFILLPLLIFSQLIEKIPHLHVKRYFSIKLDQKTWHVKHLIRKRICLRPWGWDIRTGPSCGHHWHDSYYSKKCSKYTYLCYKLLPHLLVALKLHTGIKL